ncbi:MAG: hypothetical protein LBK60_01605 [Verrucomicrobiales bacterium]|nr:hypothetical protein [Verrucomicrobiales bacterium]
MEKTSYILALAATVAAWTFGDNLHAAESSTQEKSIKPSAQKPIARLVKISEPPQEETIPSKSKVQLSGYLDKSAIQDANGKVLLSAAELKRSIHSIKISPSGRRAIISGGDCYNQIYDLEPFRAAQKLSCYLDVPNSWGLGKWEWVDDNTLVTISDIDPPESELQGLTAAEREADWRVRTLMYTYTLSDGVLIEIDTSTVGLPAVFDVLVTQAGGYLQVCVSKDGFFHTMWVRVEKVRK